MDPFEDSLESVMYFRWAGDKLWALVPMQAVVAMFLQTFTDFPQRQKSASFNIDQVLEQIERRQVVGQ